MRLIKHILNILGYRRGYWVYSNKGYWLYPNNLNNKLIGGLKC